MWGLLRRLGVAFRGDGSAEANASVPSEQADAANAVLRIDAEHSYTYAVYPFLHALEGRDRAARLRGLSQSWRHAWLRLPDEELPGAWDDTRFVIPPLRRVLFPETALLPETEQLSANEAQALRAKLSKELDPLDADLGMASESVRRFTLKEQALQPYRHVTIKDRYNNSFPTTICHADVWLFPQRIGFLILKLRLGETHPSAGRYVAWLFLLSQVLPRSSNWTLPNWQFGEGEAARSMELRAFLSVLLEDLSAPDDAETREFEHAYGRNCHLYSCACLTPETAALGDLPDPLFGTRFRRALYELATCTLTSDPNYVPSAEVVQELRQHNWLARWEVWEALSLQDHVFYLAKSYLNFLVRNVENDYLNLYLLALYQKARLRRLAGELQILQTEPSSPLKKAEHLRQQFVEFRNHYWFEEASIRPQGNAIYRAYQQGQESRPLYEAVKTELDELEEYYRELTNKRISNAVNVLALLVPLGILSQLFAGFFEFPQQISVSPLWGVAVSLLVIAGTLCLYWYLFRKRIR